MSTRGIRKGVKCVSCKRYIGLGHGIGCTGDPRFQIAADGVYVPAGTELSSTTNQKEQR